MKSKGRAVVQSQTDQWARRLHHLGGKKRASGIRDEKWQCDTRGHQTDWEVCGCSHWYKKTGGEVPENEKERRKGQRTRYQPAN